MIYSVLSNITYYSIQYSVPVIVRIPVCDTDTLSQLLKTLCSEHDTMP